MNDVYLDIKSEEDWYPLCEGVMIVSSEGGGMANKKPPTLSVGCWDNKVKGI